MFRGAKQLILAVFKHFWVNKVPKEKENTRGNAMIYVLVALALFGILTATLSSQNNQSDGQDLDDEMVEFYASELIEYAAAAKSVVDQMIMTGTTIDELEFIEPQYAAFDTAPHIHKIYHPQGGGLNYIGNKVNDNIWAWTLERGWHYRTNSNVEWTQTASNDVILTFIDLNEQICSKINEKLIGISSPVLLAGGGTSFNGLFLEKWFAPENLTTTNCPNCEGYSSLCIGLSNSSVLGFYTILAAR